MTSLTDVVNWFRFMDVVNTGGFGWSLVDAWDVFCVDEYEDKGTLNEEDGVQNS